MTKSVKADRGQLAEAARDLAAVAEAGDLAPVWHRGADADTLEAHLRQRRSVLLVGPNAVGRTSVVHALAQRSEAPLLFQTSTSGLLSGTKYLGEWQTKLTGILEALERRGWSLVLDDIWNLPHAGRASDVPSHMLDFLRSWIQSRRVSIVGEVTPEQLRTMERVPGFADLFVQQAVEPLDDASVDDVLARAADRVGLLLDATGRATLTDLTHRFLAARPQPAPALDLLRRVKDYQDQKAGIGEPESATPTFIERVFSIYAGLPRFVVSRSSTRSAADVRAWFEDRIVGQREAIESVVEAVALFKAGLHDPKRPLGTFLFVGPTGVGKTELARALATFLFGSAHRMLRFDLGEYKDQASFERLLGDAHRPHEPALLADAVRAQPFQVVLFDELEKAHPNVFDVMLSILDEGRATTPRGEVLDLRSCFVICTSNVGAGAAGKGVGFGAADPSRHRDDLLTSLQKAFRPELLARFQHIVPFQSLDEALVRRIARQALRDILGREGITSRNLVVEVDDEALDLVIHAGFDPRWGARGLVRELQRRIVLPLAMTLMERRVEAGEVLKVTSLDGRIRVRRLDTETSREARREAEPISLDGRRAGRPDLEAAVRRFQEDVEALSLTAGEAGLHDARAELDQRREDPAFWSDHERAARDLRDLDRHTRTLDRLDRLRTRVADLATDLARADTRTALVRLGARVEDIGEALASAWRELVQMGPDATWDALVEIKPIGRDRLGRDLLVRTYTAWAADQQFEVQWLRDPREEDEPAWLAVRGAYAHGLLRLEAGVHRVVDGDTHGAARVRVAPWLDRVRPIAYLDHRALKGIGAHDGKIRSRLACEGGIVLQNGNVLAVNRDLAVDVGASWLEAPEPLDAIVRRYDLVQPLVRDVLTGDTSGRPDALSPTRFHALLCRRIEVAAQGPEAA